MNTPEMKESTTATPTVIASVSRADGASEAIAMPSALNDASPTSTVTMSGSTASPGTVTR